MSVMTEPQLEEHVGIPQWIIACDPGQKLVVHAMFQVIRCADCGVLLWTCYPSNPSPPNIEDETGFKGYTDNKYRCEECTDARS